MKKTSTTKTTKATNRIPQSEIDSLARVLLPAIQALFETEEGQKEFEEWKVQKAQLQLNNKDIKNPK